MPLWLLYLLLALATHRATRLLVEDELPLVKVPRDKVTDYFGQYDQAGRLVAGRRLGRLGWSIAYLVGCPWCMSVWVATGLVFAVGAVTSVPLPWLAIAVASSVTGWAAQAESEHEQRWAQRDLQLRAERQRTGIRP